MYVIVHVLRGLKWVTSWRIAARLKKDRTSMRLNSFNKLNLGAVHEVTQARRVKKWQLPNKMIGISDSLSGIWSIIIRHGQGELFSPNSCTWYSTR